MRRGKAVVLLAGTMGALLLFGAKIPARAEETASLPAANQAADVSRLPSELPETKAPAANQAAAEAPLLPEAGGPSGKAEPGAQTAGWMYATATVNVRNIPSGEGERLGKLAVGQQVQVLGPGADGWYVIVYGEGTGYVSGNYLQPVTNEGTTPDAALPGSAAVLPPVPAGPVSARIPTEEGIYPGTPLVFIGDSRFVQMEEAVGPTPWVWIAESGKGYDWFVEKGLERADNVIGTGTKVIINLGVNDVRNADHYISLFNRKAAEWILRGAVVYYSSVNPVWTNPYVTREQVEAFNQKLQANLAPYILWIDSYHYLQSTGCRIVDGLHYDTPTYMNLYTYYMGICF